MSRQSWLQKIYWSRFAKPAEERALFKFLIDHPISSVLEIGVGDGARMRRLAQLVNLASQTEQLRYIGIDEFESAQDGGRHLTLKQAHQLTSQLGFKASLIPGNVQSAIPRVAHKMGTSDLVIINGGLDLDYPLVGHIGGWINRIAHSRSTVIASTRPGGELVVIESHKLDLPVVVAA